MMLADSLTAVKPHREGSRAAKTFQITFMHHQLIEALHCKPKYI